MNESVEEFSTPRVDADGDGLKKTGIKKRIPFPSARKFNPRAKRDEAIVLKIETALENLQSMHKKHDCLKKSQTMAEITPSKCRIIKRPPKITSTPLASSKDDVEADEVPLHATPRRPLDGSPTPTSRRCPRGKASCDVYRRLLLLSWRRQRALLLASREKCDSQKEQIQQLDLQVDVLKSLRNSESDKRKEAVAECQRTKKALDILEMENSQLVEELKNTKEALDNTSKNWNLTKCDLKNCTQQLAKVQNMLKKKKEEKMDLVNKLTDQEREIYSQSGIIARLEETLKTAKINLKNTEDNLKIKQCQLDESLDNLQSEIDLNSSLNDQLMNLQIQKSNLEDRSRILEDQLHDVTNCCEEHLMEVDDAGASQAWIPNPKNFATKSLTILHKVADVLLPIYLDKAF